MITMKSWLVTVPEGEKSIGYAGENLVFRLEIETDAPPEWAYKLDLRYADGAKNYLELNYTEGMLWCDIRREYLAGGTVRAQVRALLGEQEKHSNIFGLLVDESVLAVHAFTAEEPSAFEQLEQRLSSLRLEAENAAVRAEDAAKRAEFAAGTIGSAMPIEILDRADFEDLAHKDAGTIYLVKG